MLNALRSDVLSSHRGKFCLGFLVCLFFSLNVFAEGSRDLYPSGAQGNRAFLYSDPGVSGSSMFFPFRTEGTHYVYVKLNEHILVASSAQGVGNGIIRITSPSGVQTTTSQGNIANRNQEVAGPRYPGQGSGGSRYLPYSFQVAEAGVWKIEFIPPTSGDTDVPDISADGNWTQRNDNALIAAWDVSVRNANNDDWVRGRVYTNVLNLRLSKNFNDSNKAYYGINYVLTKDGRAYRVKNNGNNGYAFTFFSNNRGFIDASGNPTYKSQNTTAITSSVKDPRTQDDDLRNLVTHKLFYGPPASDLPTSAAVAISGTTPTSTWLKNEPIVPRVTDISFIGSEGTVGQASQKGGLIKFNTNVVGSYRITIPLGTGKDRVLNGAAAAGSNSIVWDGKDGLGNLVPGGLVVPEVRVRLASAEVHFPFIDMEINPQGIVIELAANLPNYPINPTPGIIDESVYSDRVYWDDSNITGGMAGEVSDPPVNIVDGVSSNGYGHKWGSYSNDAGSSGNSGKGQYSYGNEKSMDTYAYILSKEEAQPLSVNVKVADLQIVSIIPTFTSTISGSQITYTIKVKNDGPSDVSGAKFNFKIPAGFSINPTGINISFAAAAGTESNQLISGLGYSSSLDLANGCEATYTIVGTVGAALSGSEIAVEASIMRPKDVTDPDATNTVFDLAPADPHEECRSGTANEVCNNIKYNIAHAQRICVGSLITPFDYALEAGGTDTQILPALPAGLSKSISAGRLTISGVPTQIGLLNFTINTLGTQRSTKTVAVLVETPPVINVQPVSVPVCEGTDAIFSISSATANTYQWQYEEAGTWKNFIDGGNISGSAGASLQIATIALADQGKRIRVVLYSTAGCQTLSDEVTIVIKTRPGKPFIFGPKVLCEGAFVQLTASALTGATYQWYFNDVLISGATARNYSASEAGNYSVAVKDPAGCFSIKSDNHELTVVQLPGVPAISYDDLTVCAGNTVKLISDPADNYQWYKGGVPIAGAISQEYIATASGNYSVLVTNSGGCSESSVPVTVLIYPLPPTPTVTASGQTTFCAGGSVTLTSSASTGNQWYKDGVLLAGETGQTYVAHASGAYTVVFTDGNTCPSAASSGITVTVNPLPPAPTVSAATSTTFCAGGSVTLTSSASTGNQWYKDGVLLAGEIGQTYVANVSGSYTVVFTDGNTCPSAASAAVVVTVNPLPPAPTVSAATSTTFCAGSSVTLTSSASTGNQWYKDGVLLAGATGQTYVANVSGSYTVVFTDGNTCPSAASAAVVVTVNPLPPAPTVSAATSTTFCAGGSVVLTSSASTGNQWYKDGVLLAGETGQTYVAHTSGAYTVVFTDGNTCPSAASSGITVTVNPLPPAPTVSAATSTTFCVGGSVTLTSSASTGNQWYKDGVLLAGEIGQTYVANVSGSYTVVFTDGNTCPSAASAAVVVTVKPLPPAPTVSAATSTTFCAGSSVTLTSSASTGNQWYKDGVLLAGATGQTYVANVSGSYTVVFTDGNTCPSAASAAVVVTVNPLPPAPTVSAAASTTFCAGGSVTLTSSSTTGNQWYKDGVLLAGEIGQTYVANASGSYTVVFTDGNTCPSAASAAVVVTVNPLPPAPTVSAATSTTFCAGGSVTLTSSASTGNQWYKDGMLLVGASAQTYTADASGSYTVVFTDGNTCPSAASAAVVVTVNPLPPAPTVSAAPSTTFCVGGSVTLTSSSATGNQWYKDGVLLAGATGQTYIANVSGSYTVVFTDGNTCPSAASAAVVVTVNPLPPAPTVSAATSTTFCAGGSVTLTSSASTGNQWYKDGILLAGATGQTYVANASGSYTVVFTDGNTCPSAASAAVVVTVNPLPPAPTINISGQTTFCAGGSVVLTSSASTGNQWYKDGVLLAGAANQTYTANASGSYTVVFTDGNTCPSAASAAVVVTVNPLPPAPTVSAATSTTFCAGGSVTLTSSASTGNQWYRDGVLLAGATGQTYTANASGSYTVVFTDGNTCPSAASAGITVTVNSLPPAPTVSASGQTTFCAGGSVTLTSSASTGNQWYKDGVLLAGATGQTYIANASGSYTVVFTDGNTCPSAASAGITVTVNPLPPAPTVSASGQTTFCAGGSVTLTSSSASGNQWYKDGVLLSGETGQTYIANTSGAYTVVFTDGNTCPSAASAGITVTVNSLPLAPTVTASGQTTFCAGGSVTLTSSASTGNQWYKDGVLLAGETDQTYIANTSGAYTVVFTDGNTCPSAASAGITVTVNPLPPAPTVSASGQTTFCAGGSVTLTSSSASGNQWYKDGVLLSGETGQTYIANTSGAYTVVFTDGNTCPSAASAGITVTVNPLPPAPTVTASGQTTFCAGGSVTLTSGASTGNQWYKDGALLAGAAGQTYIANASGSYTVVFTDGNTCPSAASAGITVTVNPLPPAPTVTASGQTTFCAGGSVTLTSSASTGNQWYKDGVLLAGATGQAYIANASGSYTVVFTDGNTCPSAASAGITVTVNSLPPAPTVSASGQTTFCAGGSVTLTSSASTGNQWYKDGVLLAGATGQAYVASVSGSYTVVFTDGNTCPSAASAGITVTVNPLPGAPTVTASGQTTFCAGGSVLLTSSSASGNQWYKDGALLAGATGQTYIANASGSYTVVFTDGNTCPSAASAGITVTVNPLPPAPTVSASGQTTFCAGGSVTLTSSASTGNQWYKDGVLLAGATGQTYVANASGAYTVVFTDGNTCPSAASAGIIVTVNPLPPAPTVSASGQTTFCAGGSVLLTSSSASGNQWYKDGVLLAGETGQTYIANTSGAYTVVFTDGNTCPSAASAAVVVTVNPLPPAPTVSAATSTTFCAGGSVVLTSSASTGNQWYKDGVLLAGETGQAYVASVSGSYTVVFTDGNTCSSAASAGITVTVNPLPPAPTVSAATSTTFCAGGSVTLTSSASTGNQWYKDGALLAGATGQTYIANTSGAYTVVFTDGNTCPSAASAGITVTVNPLPPAPTVSASGQTTFCAGGSVTLTSSSASGNQWYKDGVLLSGETGQTYIANTSGAYTVVFTDGNTCPSAASAGITVTVNPLPPAPTVTASGQTTFCAGGSVSLTSSASTGNQWYKDGVLLAGATGQAYVASVSGSYTVVFTDGNTCPSAASAGITVTVNPLPPAPTVTASGQTTFCAGGSVLLTSSSASGNQWYKDGALLAGATGQTYIANASGSYTVVFTDGNTCPSAASAGITVTVNPLPGAPTVTASGQTTFCAGGSVTLTSSSATGNQWYKDGVLLAGATGQTYVANASGAYTVVFTDGNTCPSAASASVIVTVNPLPAAPTVTASGQTTFCAGGSVTLTSSASTGNQWYKDGVLLAGATGQAYIASASGSYTVVFTDGNTCPSAASAGITVTVNPLPAAPTVTASGQTTFCAGGSVTLTSSASTGNQWYKDGVLLSGETAQTYEAKVAGKYTVVVTNASNCASPVSNEIAVTVNALPIIPTITAMGNTVFCIGNSVTLSSSAASGYQWYKDGTSIPGASSKTYIATETGSYHVVVTNVNGCSSSPSLPIQVTASPYPELPNISPAGATTFCEGGVVTLTSSSLAGNQWYKNGILIPGANGQTLGVNEIGNYTVKVTNQAGCASTISAATNVTVNKVPKGFDDVVNSLSCAQSSFSYNLQTKNVNNIQKGGNAVPAGFTWTVNSTVQGAVNGSGKVLNATLINTTTAEQYVVYQVTPIAEAGGCAGQPFKITVRVPVCLDITITKSANRTNISAPGDEIKYSIIVSNNGNANHSHVKVNDPLLGGLLHRSAGDNGNDILEKGESWIYSGTYTITQNNIDAFGLPDVNTGKIVNTATVSSVEYPQSKSAIAEVDIDANPSVALVKTGAMNRDFRTMTYTFTVTNNGNMTLYNLVVKDPKITQPIVLSQTTLAPGATTSGIAQYTITNPEKVAGTVNNTATVTGLTKSGTPVTDVSGTAVNNDEPTVIDITRYPIAIDDYANTKADIEVAVPVINNDKPALFPLDAATLEVKSQPTNGKLSVNKDGKVVYMPNKGFFGIEKFTYKVDDSNGLGSNVAIVTITVVPPDLDVPNTFTPNGDGKNDTFVITGLENYEGVSLFVYNRWGDEVYRNNNYKNEWDGNGLNDGTYFYVLKLKKAGKEESRRSWILIKR